MGLGIKSYLRKKFLVHRDKVLVFTFHQSSDSFSPQNHCSYTWSDIEQFETNLNFLLDNYEIISLKRALNELREGSVRGTKISLTFDDGDITIQEFIVPLLEKYQVPATFFINSAYANNSKKGYWFNIYNYLSNGNFEQRSKITPEIESIFNKLRLTDDHNYYNNNSKIIEDLERYMDNDFSQYMSLGYLKKLNNQLFTIGLHGHEHQRFSMMSKAWKRNNLISNRMNLCNLPGYIPVFAIPFGKSIDCDKETVDLCKEFGFRIAYSDNGYNINSTSEAIMRIPADGKDLNSLIMNISPNR